MKRLLTLMLIIFAWLCQLASASATAKPAKDDFVIRGHIMANDSLPLPYTDVVLLSAKKKLADCNSDWQGNFILTYDKEGEYSLQFKFLGYKDRTVMLDCHYSDTLDIGAVYMEPDTIESGKIPYRRTTVNGSSRNLYPDGIISLTSGSVLDALREIPSVTVDINGGIAIHGNSSIRIMLDDVQSSVDALKHIHADNVSSINVDSSPDVSYDSDCTGGVIEIKTKSYEYTIRASAVANYDIRGNLNGNAAVIFGDTGLRGRAFFNTDRVFGLNTTGRTSNNNLFLLNFKAGIDSKMLESHICWKHSVHSQYYKMISLSADYSSLETSLRADCKIDNDIIPLEAGAKFSCRPLIGEGKEYIPAAYALFKLYWFDGVSVKAGLRMDYHHNGTSGEGLFTVPYIILKAYMAGNPSFSYTQRITGSYDVETIRMNQLNLGLSSMAFRSNLYYHFSTEFYRAGLDFSYSQNLYAEKLSLDISADSWYSGEGGLGNNSIATLRIKPFKSTNIELQYHFAKPQCFSPSATEFIHGCNIGVVQNLTGKQLQISAYMTDTFNNARRRIWIGLGWDIPKQYP